MLRVLVIAESEADQRIVCGLADRVVRDAWVSDDIDLSTLREWTGVEPGTVVLRWRDIKRLASAHRPAQLRALGFRPGHGGEDSVALHKALIVAELLLGNVRTAIVSRDLDTRDPASRAASHEQVMEHTSSRGWQLILAAANPMAEAWLLHGFQPANKSETEALSKLRAELGFDPTIDAHKLDAQAETAKKNAKRVLDLLLEADSRSSTDDRRCACWQESDLETLDKRGGKSGLKNYLASVRCILLPAIQQAANGLSG